MLSESKEIIKKTWSDALKWVEDIPTSSRLTLYPLQLANAIRILYNDAVFIFDEVGCGKTLSSGFIAKSFLYQNTSKWKSNDILVITTNTVKANGQFEEDWKRIDENLKPVVYNNLVNSDLSGLNRGRKWGLVVIDEAHEFSNTDTQRFEKIKKELRAEKVVFLTATPLRGGGDFSFYKVLANSILDAQNSYEELDTLEKVSDENIDEKKLLCAVFDPKKSVTRYFKDTMRYLDIHEKKENAHRVIPEIWYPESAGETRETTLVRNIDRKLTVDDRSKFVIFVRFKKEAHALCETIHNHGINAESVFANEKWKLKEYEVDKPDLPTVLILNYQIGEAGVNLPGYDHVIHWHISSDPVRLEQRYGRIDRMTSKNEKIYSCFVIPNYYDSNYSNMYSAIYYTMGELLTRLPARNVLLTEDTLKLYKHVFENKLNDYKMELEKCNRVVEQLKNLSDDYLKSIFINVEETEESVSGYEDIVDFIRRNGDNFAWEEKEDVKVLREVILGEINRQILRLEKKLNRNDDGEYIDSFEKKIKEIENKSDQIFYSVKPCDLSTLKTIDSQNWGCAKYIQENEDYHLLQEIVKLKDAVREVLKYAENDTLFAAELFYKIGEIHSFTNELTSEMSPEYLAYKYKR